MLFNSLEFLIFFITVVSVYFVTPQKYRCILLLCASYYFYMCWRVDYIVLIITSTLIDYFVGIQMGKAKSKAKRKKYLIISLFTNLGLLFSFKYFNFFNDSLRYIFNRYNIFYDVPAFKVLLPVGISFYTFQTLSYSIDVYRGLQKPEKRLGVFALYVAFFPQLVAGPIERSTRLLPQFYKKHKFDYQRITEGLSLMLWGFFKKLVIADFLSIYVSQVYSHPGQYHGLPVVLATYFFAFQIYCDFSGYSDIAIGSAKVLGFELMNNFDRPYMATSFADFWRRWHISLSTWFKDYVYIPLGGNRVSNTRHYYNLFIVFVISGLWHGANWTFVVWGALHGIYLILSLMLGNTGKKLSDRLGLGKHPEKLKFFKRVWVFNLTAFAWIFFRASSITDAFTIIKSITTVSFNIESMNVLHNLYGLKLAIVLIIFMKGVEFIQKDCDFSGLLTSKSIWVRWPVYYMLLIGIILFGHFDLTTFVYFQF